MIFLFIQQSMQAGTTARYIMYDSKPYNIQYSWSMIMHFEFSYALFLLYHFFEGQRFASLQLDTLLVGA